MSSHLFDGNRYNLNDNYDFNNAAVDVTRNEIRTENFGSESNIVEMKKNNCTELVDARSDYNFYVENSDVSFIDCALKYENKCGFNDHSFCENNNACEFKNIYKLCNSDQHTLIKASDSRNFINNNATVDYKYIRPQTTGNFASQSVCRSENFCIQISSAPQSHLNNLKVVDNEGRDVLLPKLVNCENFVFANNIKEIIGFKDSCASSTDLAGIQYNLENFNCSSKREKIPNSGELCGLRVINFPVPNLGSDFTKELKMIDFSGQSEQSLIGILHSNLRQYSEEEIKDFEPESYLFEELEVPKGSNLTRNDTTKLHGLNDSNAPCEKKESNDLLLNHSALNDSNILVENSESMDSSLKLTWLNDSNALKEKRENLNLRLKLSGLYDCSAPGEHCKTMDLALKLSELNNLNALTQNNESMDLLTYETQLPFDKTVKNSTNGTRHVCKFCNKQLHSHSGLKQHEAVHTCEYKYRCGKCDRSFLFFSRLKAHQKIHGEAKPCPICDQRFNNKQHLVDHLNRHYGVRPFKCDLCDVSFVIKGALKEHKKIHTGENLKKFQCSFCERFFKVKSYLEKHMRIHTNSKPFSCHHCQKAYNNKHDLSDHIKVKHARVKLEVCDICEKSFSLKIYLTQHYRTHTKEKPFSCDICGVRFSQYSSVTAHKRLHTGERPEKCQLCLRTFSRKFSLKVHLRTYHKMNA